MAVDGKWEITINSPMGAQKATLDFATSGDTLTGVLTYANQQVAGGTMVYKHSSPNDLSEIEAMLKKEHRDRKRGAEGYEEGRWIVLDYGDVMVHLFDAEAGDYWDIEHLWSDAKPVPVPSAGAGAR